MRKYGMVKNEELILSDTMHQDYKKVVYEEIPENFNQNANYIIQKKPIDDGDCIFIGVDVLEFTEDNLEGVDIIE